MKPKTYIEHFSIEIYGTDHRFRIETKADYENSRAFQKEHRKIYILRNGKKFLYVGEANTSIKTRLQRGFTAFRYFIKNNKARGGYKGYKWISEKFKNNSSLVVITFDKSVDKHREFVEAVEGELVFLIRQETGSWPLFQNEIHFSNQKGAAVLARKIFKHLRKDE